jgi:hypothetical protein
MLHVFIQKISPWSIRSIFPPWKIWHRWGDPNHPYEGNSENPGCLAVGEVMKRQAEESQAEQFHPSFMGFI